MVIYLILFDVYVVFLTSVPMYTSLSGCITFIQAVRGWAFSILPLFRSIKACTYLSFTNIRLAQSALLPDELRLCEYVLKLEATAVSQFLHQFGFTNSLVIHRHGKVLCQQRRRRRRKWTSADWQNYGDGFTFSSLNAYTSVWFSLWVVPVQLTYTREKIIYWFTLNGVKLFFSPSELSQNYFV